MRCVGGGGWSLSSQKLSPANWLQLVQDYARSLQSPLTKSDQQTWERDREREIKSSQQDWVVVISSRSREINQMMWILFSFHYKLYCFSLPATSSQMLGFLILLEHLAVSTFTLSQIITAWSFHFNFNWRSRTRLFNPIWDFASHWRLIGLLVRFKHWNCAIKQSTLWKMV